MKKISKNISLYIVKHPVLLFIISIIVIITFSINAPFIQFAKNVDYFELKNHPDTIFYKDFKKIFGNDEFFVIAFEKDDIFTKDNLCILKEITQKLENLDSVRDVVSLANVNDIIGENDYFIVEPFLDKIPDTESEVLALKRRALKNQIYLRNIISSDGKTAAIVIFSYERPNDPDYRKNLLNDVHNVLRPYEKKGQEFHMAGWTITNFKLSQYMKNDLLKFIPVTYILITLTIWLFFRNTSLTLLGIINISASLGATMGLFKISGILINNVTTIVPPLVMALSLSDTVHIFTHLDKKILQNSATKIEALHKILQKVMVPCFLTTLTTAIGFLSLAVSDLQPIREFAYMASAGMIFEFLFSFFLLPPMLIFLPENKIFFKTNSFKIMDSFLIFINKTISRSGHIFVVVFLGLSLMAIWYACQVRVETNLLEYFKPSSPVRKDLNFVEKHLAGVGTLDISLQSNKTDAFKDPQNLMLIEKIENYIKQLAKVDVVTSLADFIKDMNESFHNEDPTYYCLPESRNTISQYLLLYDADDINDFINDNFDHARIAVRLSEHNSQQQAKLIQTIYKFINSIQHDDIKIRITGRTVQDVNIIDALVSSQINSLALAAVTIFFILLIVLKSFKIGFLSIIPNSFPIILNFGIMGLAGIPLNTATALISTVAIGIAVDDTIHFLTEYVLNRSSKKLSAPEAIQATIVAKGKPIMASSLILCIGFGVLVLSSFVPTIHFGFLSSLIMITALIGDLILLPSIICLKLPNVRSSAS